MTVTPLVLFGRVVTFDERQPVVEDGALYIGSDEIIAQVSERSAPPPEGFADARRVETGGSIYPGLIDLHNHIAYNCLSLWASPTRTEAWARRDQWPDDEDYKPSISLPANALCQIAGEATLKYVETKAVIGGTTAIQGSAKVPYYDGWLVRNVERETFKKSEKVAIRQSVRELGGPKDFAKYRQAMDDGYAFIYHLAEGSDPGLVEEFDALKRGKCLHKLLVAIHSTALGEGDFSRWAPKGSIVWSPFSNLWLYGKTTAVDSAHEAGLRICLGADWSPSGTKNLLGELKVADICNRALMGKAFSDEQLCRMATTNPAEAIGWKDKLGRLKQGLRGDVLVCASRESDPYRNLIAATEADVLFVAVNGYPFYGTTQLMQAAGATDAESIQVGRQRRSIVLVYPGYPQADMTWKQVTGELASARADPRRHEQQRDGARPGGTEVRIQPEKPWDAKVKIAGPTLENVALPEPDPLTHNPAFFDNVKKRGFHGGILDDLKAYYG
jgi:hypothetical protein